MTTQENIITERLMEELIDGKTVDEILNMSRESFKEFAPSHLLIPFRKDIIEKYMLKNFKKEIADNKKSTFQAYLHRPNLHKAIRTRALKFDDGMHDRFPALVAELREKYKDKEEEIKVLDEFLLLPPICVGKKNKKHMVSIDYKGAPHSTMKYEVIQRRDAANSIFLKW